MRSAAVRVPAAERLSEGIRETRCRYCFARSQATPATPDGIRVSTRPSQQRNQLPAAEVAPVQQASLLGGLI